LTAHPAALFTLLFLSFTAPAFAAPADSSYALPRRESLVDRKDLALVIGATAGIALLGQLDRHFSEEAVESNSHFARGLARNAERFGNPVYIAPLLGATWIAGKVSGHPGLSASALRITGGIASSAVVATGMKELAGRSRPYQSPGDPDEFRPFSGKTAFPSGHTTVAFSLASGIDHETSARWVPYAVYPLAGLVGWSRVRDNRHWASDVVVGALVGTWTTHKFQMMVNGEKTHSLSLDLAPGSATATYRF
jgi:membrane-associated phospholipid phosphatase